MAAGAPRPKVQTFDQMTAQFKRAALANDRLREFLPPMPDDMAVRRELEVLALAMPTELYAFPIEIQRLVVAALICGGTPAYAIAAMLRTKEADFRTTFRETIDNADSIANGRVMSSLFNTALYEPDARARTTAAIFWLKTRAQWKEDGTRPGEKASANLQAYANYTLEEIKQIEAIAASAEARSQEAANNPTMLLNIDSKHSAKRSGVTKQKLRSGKGKTTKANSRRA